MSSKDVAWERFGAADWSGARDAFGAVLDESPGDPEALDGLGQALWWLGERDEGIDRRREAYARHRRLGNTRPAARLAIYLAGEHRIDGQAAAAQGWLARARRLLDGLGDVPERGWLAVEEAKRASDPLVAEAHARDAFAVAQVTQDLDLECCALAQQGSALIEQGRAEEGMALLDEAMAAALGGETSDPLATGDACCSTLVACERLSDLQRAADWCAAVVEFNDRRRFTPVQAWCRAIYGGVLIRAGDWARAEAVLEDALRHHAERRKGRGHALPLARLATLRVRQGRLDEAAQLLAGLDHVPEAADALVELHLQRGEVELARALAQRPGAQPAMRAAVALAVGDLTAARAAVAELRAGGREEQRAAADLVAGRIAAAEGDLPGAERVLEDAAAVFADLGLPLEEGRARLALARVLVGRQSPLALGSARAARDAFERLGAQRDADEAAALLRELGAAGRSAARGSRDELTLREREVLVLVTAGLSNGQIAERLVIAPKTAEHHVGRVLGKLGVRSRAEAAARAVRDGL
jgi:DNA-binding CsgD family transcriptional regulator/tetratricopeptide (TPR) repeat protein